MTGSQRPPEGEEAIASHLREWLRNTFMKGAGADAVKDQTRLLGGDLVDSIGMMELVVHLEERWAIEIPADEVTPGHFGTVGNLARYLARRTSSG